MYGNNKLQKFQGIILLRFGLITFRFAYGRTKNHYFYDFGIFGRAQIPRTNLFIFGDARTLKNNKKTMGHVQKRIIFINLNILEAQHFDSFPKDGHRQMMKICTIKS